MKTCRASLLLLAVSIFCAATASAATLYWKGGGNANVVANWCADAELTVAAAALPADGDDIVLGAGAGNMTWNLDDVTPGSWTQTADYTGTVTFNTGRKNGMTTTLYGVTDDNGETRVFRVSGNCVLMGGIWTHPAQPSFGKSTDAKRNTDAYKQGYGVYHVIAEIGGDMTVGSGFSANVNEKGFSTSTSSGHGPGGTGGSNDSANHAGIGGKNANSATKACYGRFRMCNTVGSSSGSCGGGAIEITVAGALSMDGPVFQARGKDVSYYAPAGGSISIVAGSITGSATFRANGGATTSNNGGGGGGGRISIVLTGEGKDFSAFDGTYSTFESHALSAKGYDGFGGTVYLETAADGVGGGILMVDGSMQNSLRDTFSSWGTPMIAAETQYNLKKIILRNGGRLVLPPGVEFHLPPIEGEKPNVDTNGYVVAQNNTLVLPANYTIPANCGILTYNSDSSVTNYIKLGEQGTGTLTLAGYEGLLIDSPAKLMGSLVVASGGSAGHSFGKSSEQYKFDLTVTGNATINQGGSISVNGRGYGKALGQGFGGTTFGALHGGAGRGLAGKNKHCYGSVRCPTTYGSGGEYGPGGGAIKLVAAGNFVNNGSVEANATICQYYSGSGGSVWITARTITGSGSYLANGGVISKRGNAGGAGGGGRVSLWITDPVSDFSGMTGAVCAYGGNYADKTLASGYVGGAGTVYLKTGAQAENGGTLIIRGERDSDYAAEFMSPNVTDTDVGDVLIDTYGRVLLTNVTVTVAGSWTNNNVLTANGNSFVEFTDASRVAHITGNNAFRSVVCTTPGKVIRFPSSGTSVGATGYFTIAGAQGSPVVLREENGGPWTFSVDASAMTDVEYVDVANCDASGGQTIVARSSAASAGQNNTNWSFPSIEPGQTITWTGGASTLWTDPGNWDLGRIPVETDRAVVPSLGPGANMPNLSGADVQLCDLTVASGAALSLAGLNLTVTNAMTVAGAIVYSGSETVRCLGNVNLAGAAIDHRHGDFRIEGDLAQSVNLGNLEFWNVSIAKSGGSLDFSGGFTVQNRLYVSSSAPCGISFSSGAVVGCQYTVISGPAGGGLVLSGSGWNLDVTAYANVENCSVGGCTAGGIKIYPASSCADLGSNVYWVFNTGIVRWTGEAGTTSFHDGENWSSGSVPGANDRVVIDSAVTVAIEESVSVKSLELGGGENAAGLGARAPLEVEDRIDVLTNGTLTLDSPCAAGGVVAVMCGGVITHSANASDSSFKIDLSCGALFVEGGGKVDVKGRGYPVGRGPGGGGYNQAGSYGGYGYAQGARSDCYGSVFEPVDLGSGGCYSDAVGGGAVKIFAAGEMRIDGAVCADGADGSAHYAGSGGSVYLSCSALTGFGAIRAEGGRPSSVSVGGGGRIALYETLAADFSRWEGTVSACAGRYYGTSSPGGSGGTVYYQAAADGIRGGQIVVSDWTGANGYGTPIPALLGDHADSPRSFSSTRLVAMDKSKIVIAADMKVRDVSILSPDSYFLCTEHTLRIVSRDHKDGKGWARAATTAPNGKIEWAAGFAVGVR